MISEKILLKSNQEFEIISVQSYKKDNKLQYNFKRGRKK